MRHKTEQYRRFQRENHIAKRKRIAKECYGGDGWVYANEGVFNKGKVHCSCALCRPAKHGWCKSYYEEIGEKLEKFEKKATADEIGLMV